MEQPPPFARTPQPPLPTGASRPGGPFRPPGPRPGTVLAGGLALVVLAGAAAVVLHGGPAGPEAAGRPSATASTAGVGAGAPGPALTAGPTQLAADAARAAWGEPVQPLLASAPPVTWRVYATVPLPYSASAGPRHVGPDGASGFGHDQTGALLAAVHIYFRSLQAPGRGWEPILAGQLVPGPSRGRFAVLRSTADPVTTPGATGYPAGFRILSATSDAVVVELVLHLVLTDRLIAFPLTVRWDGADWRLQLLPDGLAASGFTELDSLHGYLPWGAR